MTSSVFNGFIRGGRTCDVRVMPEGIDGWDTYFRAGKGAGANAQNP